MVLSHDVERANNRRRMHIYRCWTAFVRHADYVGRWCGVTVNIISYHNCTIVIHSARLPIYYIQEFVRFCCCLHKSLRNLADTHGEYAAKPRTLIRLLLHILTVYVLNARIHILWFMNANILLVCARFSMGFFVFHVPTQLYTTSCMFTLSMVVRCTRY